MDGFFGIGIGELVLIAIVALIVLGPERLPSALREVAKFIRWLRNLSREFTDQFGDEFKALEDLNPRRILQDAITSIDEEEKAKEEPKSVKKPATTVKTTPAKPTTPTTTGTKTTTASTPKPKPVMPKAIDSSKTVARDNTDANAPVVTTASPSDSAATNAEPLMSAPSEPVEAAAENRIAPPQLEAGLDVATPARTNGHHAETKSVAAAPIVNAEHAPATSETTTEPTTVVSHRADGEEVREG